MSSEKFNLGLLPIFSKYFSGSDNPNPDSYNHCSSDTKINISLEYLNADDWIEIINLENAEPENN